MKDSIDKICTRYFSAITRERFTYKDVEYNPKALTVSPLLLRGYTCPAGCGACCLAYTLDYLPSEARTENVVKRRIEFNGHRILIYSDLQEDAPTARCRNLNIEDGRCGIYPQRAFSCDFELIRTLAFAANAAPNVLTQKLYGRGWNMQRIDGERGARCDMTPVDPETISEVLRKLSRLKEWADHFKLRNTWLPTIIRLIETNRLTRAITLDPNPKRKGFFA